jgi:DNA topoisomerase-1
MSKLKPKPKSLVIVESPTKAKTINKILGKDFTVFSSIGHIIDLPKKRMGVDIKNNFNPDYVVIPGKTKVLSQLKKEAKGKEKIYLATDPDREGEAISWHLKNRLGQDKQFLRVIFHEITQRAVEEAFKNPKALDLNKVNAQQARRILDRLVGYFLSPLLWKKVAGGLSAGRVQSVATKLIVEREREIENFIPQEYWEIEAELERVKGQGSRVKGFIAKLEKIENKKAEIKNKEQAERIVEEVKKEEFIVTDVQEKEKKRNPSAPFTTSTLQQEAFNRLNFTTYKTMLLAQQLYEGIELGEAGPVGLITYIRTDAVRISDVALKELRDYILKSYGKDYLPDEPHIYKAKKAAQEAHEAIRPTQVEKTPELIKGFLTPEQYKLYNLIWKRFVASQMNPAIFSITSVDISAGKFLFRATGSRLIFAGFTILYDIDEEAKEKLLPPLLKGEVLKLIQLVPSQHFTKPPPRYTDASLVKALEEDGIGRPSTYSPIIYTITLRGYVRREERALIPTELGTMVTELLTEYFPKILDVEFTALMENELDEIEEGKIDWVEVLKSFYQPFSESLNYAQQNIKKEVIPTDEICEKCGKPMVIKWGRGGKFLSCSGFPKCKNAKSISTGVKCPQDGCGGELIQWRSKKGRAFYGCTNYPKCKYTTKRLAKEIDENKHSNS